METSNDELWIKTQERVRDTQKRKMLLPQIRDARKHAIIRSLQLARTNDKVNDLRFAQRNTEFEEARKMLEQLLTAYRQLVEKELAHLREAQMVIEQKIVQKANYSPALIDYQMTVKQAISNLEEEKTTTLKPLRKTQAGLQ